MTTALASKPDTIDPALIERVVIHGDLRQLTPAQKVSYYKAVCDSVGLNPLTQPFQYLTLNGKEILYATRAATEQLRQVHAVSVQIVAREVVEDCYVVTARATLPSGRQDENIGAVPIAMLKGEARANAMMKAETKAKRRVTLAICGLGMLDELEVATIPHASYSVDAPTLPKPAIPPGGERETRVGRAGESNGQSSETRSPDGDGQAHEVTAHQTVRLPNVRCLDKRAAGSEPAESLPAGAVYIERVDMTATKNKNVKKYILTLTGPDWPANQTTVSTINDRLASLAEQCREERTPVLVTTRETKWGWDLDTLTRWRELEDTRFVPDDDGPPLTDADIPF